MKIKNKKNCLSIFIILAVIAITNMYASDKVDSTLIKRVLPNGLTYYIKHLPDAGDKVFMRFYVNAGNRVATSGQPDVAHAIEHLAFAATKNFPLGISSYPKLLEESGMEGRGRDMYAFNGQDGTVYHFDTNSYNLKGMELGIRWFQDILGGLSLTSEDIEIERERLIQERYSNNQVRRKHAVIRSEMYAGIFPCNRSKQGYKEKIKNFAEDSLRAYYKDWYQPKNVGIVIVGNIPDVRVLENKIKQGFLKFQNKKNTNELPDCDAIYFSRSNQFKIIERPTEDNIPIVNNKIEINLFYRDSLLRSTRGIESSKRQLLWEITNEVLDKKLQELTHSYTTNFDIGVVNMIKLDNSKPAASSIIIEGDSLHIEGGISEVYTKINELKTYGLSAEEWSKLKKKYLDYLNNNLNERDRGAKVWANNIGENFLYNLPLLNSDQNKRLISWLTQFNTKDINQLIASLINPLPQDIGIIKPKNSDWLISESEIRSLIYNNLNKPVSQNIPVIPASLMTDQQMNDLKATSIMFEGGKINGTREYLLENGIRIILLEESDNKGELSVWGFDSIGAADIKINNLFSATKIPRVIRHSGLGKYNKFEVERYLKSIGGDIKLVPYISTYESGIKGHADLRNMELLFQMMYLYFTAPRMDEIAFEHWRKSELKTSLRPPYNLQNKDFNNAIDQFFGDSKSNFFSGTAHYDGVQKVNFEEGFNAYRRLFSDFSNYTFIIKGPITVNNILPYIKKYLGNLNTNEGPIIRKSRKDLGTEFPSGPQQVALDLPEYNSMGNGKYSIRFVEKIDHYDWKKHLMLELLSQIIWEKALKLRANAGVASYYIYVGGNFNKNPFYLSTKLGFDVPEDHLDRVQSASKRLFREIKEGKVDANEYALALNKIKRYYGKNGIKADKVDVIYNYYRYGIPPVYEDERIEFLKELKKAEFHRFVKSFLSEDHLFEFKMI